MVFLSRSQALSSAYGTLVAFFVIAIVVASLPSHRKYLKSLDSYLSARRSVGAIRLGFSFFSSAMGSWIVFGVPQAGALMGPWGVIGYTLALVVPFFIVARLAMTVMRCAPEGITSLEFIRKRFGSFFYYICLLVSIYFMFIFMVAEYTASSNAILSLTSFTTRETWQITLGVALITAAYTAYGGLITSISTDFVQGIIVIVLVIVGCAAAFSQSTAPASAINAAAKWTSQGFGTLTSLMIGLSGATLFNQSVWLRCYAAKDNWAMWKGIILGALLIAPTMILFGLSGILSLAEFPIDTRSLPELSFFYLISSLSYSWQYVLVIMIVSLVCSSADSAQNALTAILTVEVEKIPWEPIRKKPLIVARVVALLLQGPAIGLASGSADILRLFLIADIVAASVMLPAYLGLFPFFTMKGAICGAAAGFLSVFVQGWVDGPTLAAGFKQLSMPGGIYANATTVSFVLSFCVSGVAAAVVSYIDRMYAHIVRTRAYLKAIAAKEHWEMEEEEDESLLRRPSSGQVVPSGTVLRETPSTGRQAW